MEMANDEDERGKSQRVTLAKGGQEAVVDDDNDVECDWQRRPRRGTIIRMQFEPLCAINQKNEQKTTTK